MASLKQHKAIGEDLWKGRTDKIVGLYEPHDDRLLKSY
jgi:hypothetical protein